MAQGSSKLRVGYIVHLSTPGNRLLKYFSRTLHPDLTMWVGVLKHPEAVYSQNQFVVGDDSWPLDFLEI